MKLFNTEYKIKTDKEKQIQSIIKEICNKEDAEVRIDPSNGNIFISQESNHYDIVLLHSSIIITNSTFCLRESFNIGFIDNLKNIANIRASKDRQEVLNEILSRESNMLLTIENNLSDEQIT